MIEWSDLLKWAAIPAAIVGIIVGRATILSHKQLKADALATMDFGIFSATTILKRADPQLVKQAYNEYVTLIKTGNSNTYTFNDTIRKIDADNLNDLLTQIDNLLSLTAVYFKPATRKKILQLRNSLTRGKNHFSNTPNLYALGRCYKLIDQMNAIKALI